MNFLKRIWKKRWLRRLTWTGVTLVTLYALLCAWVNWSGARQWRATVAMLKAEGETLDFRETLYEPVPEAENFCAIPLLKDIALVLENDKTEGLPGVNRKRLEALKLPSTAGSFTDAIGGTRANLKEWADCLRKEGSLPMPADSADAARDVLAALSKYEPVVQELTAGLNRTKAQWTPEWKTRVFPSIDRAFELPHLTVMFGSFQTLDLRAIAAVRAGDATKAHETALIMARINQAYINDPFLVCVMISAVGSRVLHSLTWELCAVHAGTVEDFVKLESALAAFDYQRAVLHAMRSEMAAMTGVVRAMKTWREDNSVRFFFQRNTKPNRAVDMLIRAIPAGVFDANAAVLAELEFGYIIKPLKELGWKQALASAKDLNNELIVMRKNLWSHPSGFMATRIGPLNRQIIYDCTYAQTLVNQAMVACALERHRIENGSYPDSLDAVRLADGKPLPSDPMDGKPMRYRKTADGRYALWSIGPDGKDDGGKRIIQNKDPEHTSFDFPDYIGDLVWDFAGTVK